jgi:hypothetical protein
MSEDNNNYYLKYLKYKKKYLDLIGGKKKHRSFLIPKSSNSSYISPIVPILTLSPKPNSFLVPTPLTSFLTAKPQLRTISPISGLVTSPGLVSSTGLVTSPGLVSSTGLVTSPGLVSSTGLVSGTGLITRPILPFVNIFSSNNYNEFDGAFDTVNKKFDRNVFSTIFNLKVNNQEKTYSGKKIIDFTSEKEKIEQQLKINGLFTDNTYNSFEMLMTKLVNQNLHIFTVLGYQRQLELQKLIKNYIVLDTIIKTLQ